MLHGISIQINQIAWPQPFVLNILPKHSASLSINPTMSSSNGVQKNPEETSTLPEAEPLVAQPTPKTTITSNNTNTTNQKKDGKNNNVGSPDPATQPTVEGTSTTNIKNGEITSEAVVPHKVESTTVTSNNNNGGNSGNLGICARIWSFPRKEKKKQTNYDGSSTVRKENSNSSSLHSDPVEKSEKNLKQIKEYLDELQKSLKCQSCEQLTSHLKHLEDLLQIEREKNKPHRSSKTPEKHEHAEIHKEITKFKQQISSLTKLSKKVSDQSADLKTSSGSNGQSGVHGFPNVHNNASFNGSSFYNEIQSIFYEVLDDKKKFLLSCFAVLPENAVVKRRLLTYWGVGEGKLDVSGTDRQTQEPEKIVDGYLKEFTELGLIEPVIRKRKQKVKSYKMDPLVRSAVIKLSKGDGLFDYDSKGNVVAIANPLNSRRACLQKEEESSSEQENQVRRTKSLQISDLENLVTLFNVNEPFPDLELALLAKMKDSSTKTNDSNPSSEKKDSSYLNAMECLAKMKSAKVLCLGSWAGSAKSHIEVESIDFLEGLTSMKELMFLSLQGISRIDKLPSSIGTLSNLLILDLKECHNLEDLSEEIGKLKKLRYLDVSDCHLLAGMPKGLSALSELQVLKGFVLRPETRRSGTLDELKGLKKLRKLAIIATSKDFPTPNDLRALNELGEKGQLRKLTIAWDWGVEAPKTVSGSKTMAKGVASMTEKLQSKLEKLDLQCCPKQNKAEDMTKFPMKLPSKLEKLDLQCFPEPTSTWLIPGDLQNIKKLYIRGGNLATLNPDKNKWPKVDSLRLKFLRELKMTWIELVNSFPNLEYLEKVKCPRISLCPCDENGVWMKPADNDHIV